MNVLQVASSLRDWGGIERYVHYLADGLTSRGHGVSVACPPGSPLHQRVNVPVREIGISSRWDLRAISAYRRLLRAERFDIAHVHFSPDFLMPVLAARFPGGPKVVLTRHLALRWSRKKAKAFVRRFDHIVPVSDAVRVRLAESGIPESMMTVAKAGCPPLATTRSRDEARASLSLDPASFVIGSFGRLVPEKGVQTLIAAIPHLPETVVIEVFGDGPAKAELESAALGHVGRIRFRGKIADVADAMSAMDAIAIPSTWEEAFPYAALEAMSLGRPLIASHIGGLPEMVREGETGWLFEAGSAEDFARVASEMASQRDEARRRGERGRAWQSAEFTIDAFAERMERVYERVVGNSAS